MLHDVNICVQNALVALLPQHYCILHYILAGTGGAIRFAPTAENVDLNIDLDLQVLVGNCLFPCFCYC